MDDIISIESLTKRFPVGDGYFTALKDIDLCVKAGEFVGLIGPSGSGKTTLLNIIGTLDSPTVGKATVLGHDVGSLTHRQAADLRNEQIGFIFQEHHLLPVYTVFENVEFALLLQKVSASERKKRVMEALEWVGLTHKSNSKPNKLSGGESQRVAVARALVKKPAILLADEPSANLDAENAHNIMRVMAALNKELHTTFIFSTHDEKVMQYVKRMVGLKDGFLDFDRMQSPAPPIQPS